MASSLALLNCRMSHYAKTLEEVLDQDGPSHLYLAFMPAALWAHVTDV